MLQFGAPAEKAVEVADGQHVEADSPEHVGEAPDHRRLPGPLRSGDHHAFPCPDGSGQERCSQRGQGIQLHEVIEATNGATSTRADLHLSRSRDGELFITSRQDGMIRMLVPDSAGTGAPVERRPDAAQGRGLLGMRERVNLFGGELHVGPGPDGGGRPRPVGRAGARGAGRRLLGRAPRRLRLPGGGAAAARRRHVIRGSHTVSPGRVRCAPPAREPRRVRRP